MHETTKDPCVKVCRFSSSGDTGVCVACFRTRSETRKWKRLTEEEKLAINRRVRPLMDGSGKGGKKKLRKIEKRIAKLERRLGKLRTARAALLADQPVASS